MLKQCSVKPVESIKHKIWYMLCFRSAHSSIYSLHFCVGKFDNKSLPNKLN